VAAGWAGPSPSRSWPTASFPLNGSPSRTAQGLGQPVLKAIANQYFTLGMFNGLAIVGIAIIFDRVSQAYGKRLQKHREIIHG
jgi:hypothetical protein